MINQLCEQLKKNDPNFKFINATLTTKDDALRLLYHVQGNIFVVQGVIKINHQESSEDGPDDFKIICKCAYKIKEELMHNRCRFHNLAFITGNSLNVLSASNTSEITTRKNSVCRKLFY